MRQAVLFDCGYPLRPGRYSREVTKLLVEELLPNVISWWTAHGDTVSDDDVEEAREHLLRVLEFDDDSYDIVRRLDQDFMWSVDRKSTRLNSSHVSESRMPSSA